MSIKRRQFIKALGGGALFAISGGMPNIALSATPAPKKLVVIFQRFGNDGHNTFVPFTENNYFDLRKTLAIPEPNPADTANTAIDLGAALNGTSFGMHPNMTALKTIWDNGDMAVFPATHVGDNANRSHFFMQDFIDKGDHRLSGVANNGDGWLNRWLSGIHPIPEGLQAFSFTNPKSIRVGEFPALSIGDLRSIGLGGVALDSAAISVLRARLQADFNESLATSWAQQQEIVYSNLSTLQDMDLTNNVSYPSSKLGRELSQTANLIRNVPELSVVTIDTGGFDTHAGQGSVTGNHANLLANFSDSVAAFYTDMGDEMENIALVVLTEFGRTLDENASGGTDHGWASSWCVISKAVTGGLHGEWPGLDNNNIGSVGKRFMLNDSVDYRDILSDVLINHMGGTISQAEAAFPGYAYNSPLNFL